MLLLSQDKDGNGVLTAAKGLKEGQLVMVGTCLCFSGTQGVAEFLNNGGNAALLDGPLVQVTGLHMPGEDTQRMSVYAVLVGLAR